MQRKFYTSFLLLAALVLSSTSILSAQSTAGPIEITSFAGSEEITAGENFPHTFHPGESFNIKGMYGNIGAAQAVWATYDVWLPDWSGTGYSGLQPIANDTLGTLDGNIDFDYVLGEDAPYVGQFHDSSDVNNVLIAFHILQVRVAYEPHEDTFWNIFIDVQQDVGTATVHPVLEGLEIFPNPATEEITINTPESLEKTVRVFDATGKAVLETSIFGNQLDISQLNAGFYLIRVEENGKVAGQKLMIK